MRAQTWLVSLVLILTGCAGSAGQAAGPAGPSPAQLASVPASVQASPAAVGSAANEASWPAAQVGDDRLSVSRSGWKTDFNKHVVPLSEIASGGPGKDGISAVDKPKFVDVAAGDGFLKATEAVMALSVKGEDRAYPIQILVWHEIVNDEVNGDPVTVTFCPLCNTGIAFDRRLEGKILDFGTTGNLRNSDLVMYDRETESWWQQAEGRGIVGRLAGKELTFLPAEMVSWGQFKAAHPGARVLSRDTGFSRPYGHNPYIGYDAPDSKPFLFSGKPDGRLKPMERVLTLSVGAQDKAYPLSVLARKGVVTDQLGAQPVVIFFQVGLASALDKESTSDGRDVGAAAAFDPRLDGRGLTFDSKGGKIIDSSGSEWNIFGQAVNGPLAGKQLQAILSGTHFWFAWAAFKPTTTIYGG